MLWKLNALLALLFVVDVKICSATSNGTRPLPQWFDDAKFGIFIHWGVFSVPSFESEWFWAFWKGSDAIKDFMRKNYRPGFTYQDFAPQFKAEFFDPNEWADLFERSGAKYVVLTAKHHEGYTLWPSQYSFGWNAKDVGPNRDLVGDLATAIRNRTKIRFGVYHSLREWFHPLYIRDGENGFKTNTFVRTKIMPESKELVQLYKPDIFWSDGGIDASDKYWESEKFLNWLYNESPVKEYVVANDRWGLTQKGVKHGDFANHGDNFDPGVLQKGKWESDMSVDKYSFGYRRNAHILDYRTTKYLLQRLVKAVSCGGNLLMNIGPTKEGTIDPIFQERLLEMGDWLQINGEAIYFSKPWTFQKDTDANITWYTHRPDKEAVYAMFFEWPISGMLKLTKAGDVFDKESTSVHLLGNTNKALRWFKTNQSINIQLPKRHLVVSKWVWTLKLYDV